MTLLAPVHFNNGVRVDGQLFVRVNDHTEKARVGLRQARGESVSGGRPGGQLGAYAKRKPV